MDLFHKIMELVDKNADKIPEGGYLELCGAIKALREQVMPPPKLKPIEQDITFLVIPGLGERERILRFVDTDEERDELHGEWEEIDELFERFLNEYII
jgi:hypothetical protein